MGDTTICKGRVIGKRKDGEHYLVDIEMTSTNQRGENTAPGTATVILPSRVGGPVVLPAPEPETERRAASILRDPIAVDQVLAEHDK